MDGEILYNFGSNNASLDDINSRIHDIQEVRGDINSIFNTLATVYEGEGAQALHQAQLKVGAMLDEALNNTANTQKQALDQQAAMQAMDRANAAAF
jgi:uncharacterized protein YukE